MNTREMTGEQISAFADGECAESHVEMALAALREPEGKAAWDIYHQIGDVLRSDDMAVELSPGFAARMAARLEAEPTVIAPVSACRSEATSERAAAQSSTSATRSLKRWALPGMVAAAAAAAVAFVTTPQLMVAMKGGQHMASVPIVASTGRVLPASATASASDSEQGAVVAASVPGGEVLRDERIDDYLMAHQRFSPSVFNTAQYARSATFETDSSK